MNRRRTANPLAPEVTALSELDALERQADAASAVFNELYAQLNDSIRRYFEARFHLPASRRTTAELLAAVESDPVLFAEKERLGAIFAPCDLAKFAGEAGKDGWKQTAQEARQFIHRVTPPANP